MYIFDQDKNFIKEGNHKSLICLSYQCFNGNQQKSFADYVKFKWIAAAPSCFIVVLLTKSTKRQNDVLQYNAVWKRDQGKMTEMYVFLPPSCSINGLTVMGNDRLQSNQPVSGLCPKESKSGRSKAMKNTSKKFIYAAFRSQLEGASKLWLYLFSSEMQQLQTISWMTENIFYMPDLFEKTYARVLVKFFFCLLFQWGQCHNVSSTVF